MTKQEAIERLKSLKRANVEFQDGTVDVEDTHCLRGAIRIAIDCIERVIQAEEHAQPMVDLIQMLGDELGDYDWR